MNALEIVQAYINERYEADLFRRKNRQEIAKERSVTPEEDHKIFEEAYKIAQSAHNQFWESNSERPVQLGLGWPSEFDFKKYSQWSVEDKGDEVIVSAQGPALTSKSKHLYFLKDTCDGYKIYAVQK